MGDRLAHRGGAEADLAGAARKRPAHRREQERSSDSRSHDDPHAHLVKGGWGGRDKRYRLLDRLGRAARQAVG